MRKASPTMIMALLALLVTLGGLLWTVPGEAAEAPGASGGPFRARPVQARDLRWQDISDCHYSPAFRAAFSYQRTVPLLEARISAGEAKPFGHLRARRLKPNFAYQLKLCGRGSLLGSTEAENGLNAEAWANWELGRQGRWWCEECRWNVGDWDLRWHLSRGHHVNGYLLFGWFVTDAQGAAEVDFRVLSSYHVLWKVDQRRPARYDGRPFEVTVRRTEYGYRAEDRKRRERVTLYGEWETGRALPGQLALAPGPYPVLLNLTEESFHSGGQDGGGNWAQVLETPVEFTVAGSGGGTAGYAGAAWSPWQAVQFFAGRTWDRLQGLALEAMKPRDGQ